MEVTAKSLALDLLSTVRGRSMPVSAMIAAAEAFGIDANAVRVALARCLAKGTVQRDERGEYRLGPARSGLQSQLASWRRLSDRTAAWSGAWIGVHGGEIPRSERRAMRGADRALQYLGFAEFSRDLAIRPDNLKGGIDSARERLAVLGLDARATVFEMRGLGADAESRARSLWNTEEIRAGYRLSIETIRESATMLHELPEPQAMVESFIVGGRALRQLILDPLLPPPMVPAGEFSALLTAMKNYDRIGRAVWKPFLERHGVSLATAPTNFAASSESDRPLAAGDAR